MNLKDLRARFDLSVADMARCLGITRSALYKYETGERRVPLYVTRTAQYIDNFGTDPHRNLDKEIKDLRLLVGKARVTIEKVIEEMELKAELEAMLNEMTASAYDE